MGLKSERVQTLDFVKLGLALLLLGVMAPAIGFLIRHNPKYQRIAFFLLCFCTIGGIFRASEWGFTIHSLLYRGTARGFHFYWGDVLALIVISARMFGSWKNYKLFPPGSGLYLLYCFASLISIFNAPEPIYSWFAFFKMFKMVLVFIAAYNFIRDEEDLRFFLRSMAAIMCWQCAVVLKMKYLDGIYQVYGTFEHQNSLAMFTILIAMVFLGVALGPSDRSSNFYLFAYLVCAVIVQSTLSRGGLAMFALGTAAVVMTSLMERVTKRRLTVLASLGLVGVVGLLFTADTILGRFNDYGNQESKNTRDMLNVSARMMLNDHKLGIGLNNFAHAINKPFHYGDHIDRWHLMNGNSVDPNYKKGTVESLWWLILSETGVQGLLTYLLLIGVGLYWNLRAMFFFKHHLFGAVAMGIFWGCTMNYLQSFLERVLTQPRNMILWLLLLAVGAKINTWRKTARLQNWRPEEPEISEALPRARRRPARRRKREPELQEV